MRVSAHGDEPGDPSAPEIVVTKTRSRHRMGRSDDRPNRQQSATRNDKENIVPSRRIVRDEPPATGRSKSRKHSKNSRKAQESKSDSQNNSPGETEPRIKAVEATVQQPRSGSYVVPAQPVYVPVYLSVPSPTGASMPLPQYFTTLPAGSGLVPTPSPTKQQGMLMPTLPSETRGSGQSMAWMLSFLLTVSQSTCLPCSQLGAQSQSRRTSLLKSLSIIGRSESIVMTTNRAMTPIVKLGPTASHIQSMAIHLTLLPQRQPSIQSPPPDRARVPRTALIIAAVAVDLVRRTTKSPDAFDGVKPPNPAFASRAGPGSRCLAKRSLEQTVTTCQRSSGAGFAGSAGRPLIIRKTVSQGPRSQGITFVSDVSTRVSVMLHAGKRSTVIKNKKNTSISQYVTC